MATLTWKDQGVELILKALQSEPSLWRVVQLKRDSAEEANPMELTVGLIGVYVDDLLITCLRWFLQGTIKALESLWQLSKPKFLSGGQLLRC